MTKPDLYVFAISHYCEKACWALDYLGIDFAISHVAPGLHVALAKKLGAPHSSVPILVEDGQVVQGSAAIIDWADAATAGSKRLTPQTAGQDCVALEERLDDVIGVHVRRYYYSEALVEHSPTVKPIFIEKLGLLQKLLVGSMWSVVRKRMIKGMDLGSAQGQDSKSIIEGELQWLDGLLSDGRQFLIGEKFSRVDLTAASLLAPLAIPMEHPTYSGLVVPPRVADDLLAWKNRPVINWVREIYRQYRSASD